VNGSAATNNGDFDDASSSALLASTVYRLSLLTGKNNLYIPQAERTRLALFSSISTEDFSHTPHFTSDGWLTPVVDPDDISEEGAESPEGEAFVLMLYSAWRDWVEVMGNETGSSSSNSSSSSSSSSSDGDSKGKTNDAARAIPGVGGVVVGLAIMALACGDVFS
jgi:hypothetical protein